MAFRPCNQAANQKIQKLCPDSYISDCRFSRIYQQSYANTMWRQSGANEVPTLYSRVCFNISSSSRVKLSSTDTARISWNAWWSKGHTESHGPGHGAAVKARGDTEPGRRRLQTSHLSLSRWHELENDVLEVLKVDLSWVVKVCSVGHFGVEGRRVVGGCWWRIWTNTFVSFGPDFWWLLPGFRVWLRFQPLWCHEWSQVHFKCQSRTKMKYRVQSDQFFLQRPLQLCHSLLQLLDGLQHHGTFQRSVSDRSG